MGTLSASEMALTASLHINVSGSGASLPRSGRGLGASIVIRFSSRFATLPPQVRSCEDRKGRTRGTSTGEAPDGSPVARLLIFDHQLADEHSLEHEDHVRGDCPSILAMDQCDVVH